MFSSSQRTSNRVGTRGGRISYDDDDDDEMYDNDDDDDNSDDDDDDDNNYSNGVFSSFFQAFVPLFHGMEKVGLLTVKLVLNLSLHCIHYILHITQYTLHNINYKLNITN